MAFPDSPKLWTDVGSWKGAFTVLENAKKSADEKPGYAVLDWNGEHVYPQKAETGGMTDEDCSFLVKVSIPDLNIRKGSGTNTAKTGKARGFNFYDYRGQAEVRRKAGAG